MDMIVYDNGSYDHRIYGTVPQGPPTCFQIKKRRNSLHIIVGNPNRKKMHIFGFVGIFEYIC